MKITNRRGFLGILLALVAAKTSQAVAKATPLAENTSEATIDDRLAKIRAAVGDRKQQMKETSPELSAQLNNLENGGNQLVAFGDFIDHSGSGFGDFIDH